MRAALLALSSVALLWGCDDDDEPISAPLDARAEAGPRLDAGPVVDATPITDAAPVIDAAPLDAAVDAAPVTDAAPTIDAAVDATATPVTDARPDPDAALLDAAPDPDSLPAEDAVIHPDAAPPVEGEIRRLGESRFFELSGLSLPEALRARRVIVYVPPGYDDDPQRRYPVLYAHDGQNLFHDDEAAFGMSWRFHPTSDALILAGRIEPFITVAIDNTPDRMWDYTGSADPEYGGGGASVYLGWIVDTLKPAVDGHFRTQPERERTGVMGSSLGGLASLWALKEWPEVFGRVGIISPSVWWNDREPLEWAQAVADAPIEGTRIWLDNGSEEGDDSGWRASALPSGLLQRAVNIRQMLRILITSYPFGASLGFLEDYGALHNELSWALRLEHILTFLWGDPDLRAPLGVRLRVARAPIPLGGAAGWALDAYYPELTMTIPPEAGLVEWGLDEAALAVSGDALLGLAEGRAEITATVAGASDTLGVTVAADEGRAWATIRVWTPAVALGSFVHVTGTPESWGPWAPDGQRLTYDGEAWRGLFALPLGAFEYKLTRGTWETVEKTLEGGEAPNRIGALGEEGGLFEGQVLRWADQ